MPKIDDQTSNNKVGTPQTEAKTVATGITGSTGN